MSVTKFLKLDGKVLTKDGKPIKVNLEDMQDVIDCEDEIDNQSELATQNDSDLDDLANLIANGYIDGSPKGVYASLSALQTAYPTGTSGVYICSDTGHWYFWNGSAWTDGGVYQATDGGELRQDMIMSGLANDVTLEIIDGYFISNNGAKLANNGYKMTSPISLKKDTIVEVYTQGYLTNLSIISKLNNGSYIPLLVSEDSTYKKYIYKITEDMKIVISGKATCEIKCKALKNLTDLNYEKTQENIDVNYIDGYYIAINGTKQTLNNYYYTEPINILKGQSIRIYAKGYLTNVAILSKYEGNKFTTLISSIDSNYREYNYVATETMKVVISGNNHTSYPVSVSASIDNCKVIDNLVEEIILNNNLYTNIYDNVLQLFHKIGGIGDSLMSGEIGYFNGTENIFNDCYKYSWLSNLGKKHNVSVVHYSNGGLTAKTWLESSHKTNLVNEEEKPSAYFIALGTNDRSRNLYPLGNSTDGVDVVSFCGYMKKIIETVRASNPNCFIFLNSLYFANDNYNTALNEIANIYDKCYYIDFYNNSQVRSNTSFISIGHFNEIGYYLVSEEIDKVVSNIIKNNSSDFFNFAMNYKDLK